ncbi:MAG TPA: rhomboid family intramembrane serine protease [Bryobacteraceae bacterium]|nr:rhomboid family intramembrane serine protease [Bryobacteraceae bacterium]
MPYRRYTFRRSAFFGYFPTGVKWLLISNTVIFILTSLAGPEAQSHILLLALAPVAVVKHFAWWQLVTYMFLHGGVWHLIFNMLTLWMFGVSLEQDWGTRRFLKYYFYCGIAAGLCDVLINAAIGNWGTRTIGSSGAIFGLLLAFGVLYPNQTVLMDFLFPIKAKYMVMIYAAVELWLSFGVNTGVSSLAHLGGMAFGYAYLKARWSWFSLGDARAAYNQWRLARAKKKFQVYLRKQGRDRGPWMN